MDPKGADVGLKGAMNVVPYGIADMGNEMGSMSEEACGRFDGSNLFGADDVIEAVEDSEGVKGGYLKSRIPVGERGDPVSRGLDGVEGLSRPG